MSFYISDNQFILPPNSVKI